jgi:hypothetical protein
MSKRKGHQHVGVGTQPPAPGNVRRIGHGNARLVRVAVKQFANGAPLVGVVSIVVPGDMPTAAIIDRAIGIVRRDKGIPGMALTGSLVTA